MTDVTMYSTQVCGYCRRAEQLLKGKGVDHMNKIFVDVESDQLDHMIALTGRRTVPQIFIGNVHVGGFDDLVALDRAGGLDTLLSK